MKLDNSVICSVCSYSKKVSVFLTLNSGTYLECASCEFIFFVDSPSQQENLHTSASYSDTYWLEELAAAQDRAFGVSLARAAEVFILARRHIGTFLDIGTGPGLFLDAIDRYLPDSETTFLGVELFPPKPEFQTSHPGYRVGWLDQFEDDSIDGGMCIEVLEHLLPIQVKELFQLLHSKATNGATFIFNTGLVEYVKNEDPSYLDPVKRGHISIWSVRAIEKLISDMGWNISSIPNRSWAFLAEKGTKSDEDLSDRIWKTLPENVAALSGKSHSKLLYLLGRDGLRAV